jgi:hypothetical protein
MGRLKYPKKSHPVSKETRRKIGEASRGKIFPEREKYPAIGDRFGKWTVIDKAARIYKNRVSASRCRCDCGLEQSISNARLKGGLTKSCRGCAVRKLEPFQGVYNRLLVAASKREISIDLSFDDFLKFTTIDFCFYCDERVIWKRYGARGAHTNLDRKDNTRGYHADNCVVCCFRCNHVKGSQLTFEEMIEVGKVLKSFREKRK